MRQILIQDPYHDYAARFIELGARRHGVTAVCFFTDPLERARHEHLYPVLRSEKVSARYDVPRDDLSGFLERTLPHHRIAAVLPVSEPTLPGAVRIAHALGLSWADPAVLARFSDKFLLKQYLRDAHPHLRINASRRIANLAEVLAARASPHYRRFVLKPNSGFGNRDVGMFDAASPASAIEEFLRSRPQTPMVMEQYIEGEEYFVNGQVDAGGETTVVAIFKYSKVAANGRDNIDYETALVPRRDANFDLLAHYAAQVLRATGLRRSPFHLELKLDASGPCLVEIGARLAGLGNAEICGRLHGPDLDLLDLALHYYLHDADYGPLPLDWTRYDSSAMRYVHGIATRAETVYRLEGVAQIEAMPEFYAWVKKPDLGTRLEVTTDILTMPYCVILQGPDDAALVAAAANVRRLLRWNASVSVPRRVLLGLWLLGRRCAVGLRIRIAARLRRGSRWPFARWLDSVALRWQRRFPSPPLAIDPRGHEDSRGLAAEITGWAVGYLGAPHPQLRREGAICPFVRPSVELERLVVTMPPMPRRATPWRLRATVLGAARAFAARFPVEAPKNQFASLVLAFPGLAPDRFALLDRVHDQLKTHLATEFSVMSTPFHPASNRPSASNPAFRVFRGPYPMFVLRHIDIRDIRFVDSNRRAFLHYHRRFAAAYESGAVDDRFGDLTRFRRARTRFGLLPPADAQ